MKGKCGPNFMIIGAGKSGTTTLAHHLGQHPDIFVSDPKEPHYFTLNWDRGAEWYTGLFEGAGYFSARGEASATYTLFPEFTDVPKRIRQYCEEGMRFIYIVRHPVERMLSHWAHDKMAGNIPVEQSIEDLLGSGTKYEYASSYALQIEQYLQYFDQFSIKVVVFEKYIENSQPVLRELFQFLGVDAECAVEDLTAKNVSSQNRHVPGWIREIEKLKEIPLIGQGVRGVSRALRIKDLAYRVMGRKLDKERLSQDQYNALLEQFHTEIERLSKMLGCNLYTVWGEYKNMASSPLPDK